SMVTDGQRLGVQCFMNCTSLASVTLSGSLSALPDGMFSGCIALSEVRGNDRLPRGGNAFYGCDRLAGREESGT
ncbi:MAG: leucine-rich repeat protein, partial [Eubacteriales bacterium]